MRAVVQAREASADLSIFHKLLSVCNSRRSPCHAAGNLLLVNLIAVPDLRRGPCAVFPQTLLSSLVYWHPLSRACSII